MIVSCQDAVDHCPTAGKIKFKAKKSIKQSIYKKTLCNGRKSEMKPGKLIKHILYNSSMSGRGRQLSNGGKNQIEQNKSIKQSLYMNQT
jgi:hypothetical protein